MNATPQEIRRALEIIMSNLKFDSQTADILRYHLATQCQLCANSNSAVVGGE